MAHEIALKLETVTKLYKNGRGIEDISFTLAPGEVLGLLGPNGSGKTTTMKAIAGLVKISKGSIQVCGVDAVSRHEEAMKHTGCLIESPALYEYMTVERNLKMAAQFYSHISNNRVEEVLHMVEMYKYKNDKIATLSLGMRQRVGIAAALLSKPLLLILDEPANGLDIEGMIYVREVVKQVAGSGSAVLISSHLANEIQLCATKVAIIHGGRLLVVAKMDTILESFASLEDFFLEQVNKSREKE